MDLEWKGSTASLGLRSVKQASLETLAVDGGGVASEGSAQQVGPLWSKNQPGPVGGRGCGTGEPPKESIRVAGDSVSP